MWLTRDCLLRYLRATKWNQAEASKRLLATISWRREYGVEGLTPEHISPENETGKQLIFGYDNDARPCLYLNPGRQNTSYSPRQNQHLVFMLERVIELMPPGQENLALLINYKDTSSGKKGPGLSQGKEVLNILQNHYPERLGRCLISDLPWFITTFYKLITPFIDPVTRPKLKFNPILPEHVPASQLVATVGGDVEFEYAHDVYWPALNRLCEERREAYRRRWEDGGKRVGESERVLRGGELKGQDSNCR
ncbi:CRAL/TRIO domain-containing protein [Patellaria atrata CBS 101060]|uniref:CRAL/TRIO domain-containing protein n=1 Tax=Patellaria atrata CBS 101060 TaxID=1346257 RepID=A0A9P4S8K5_9PEZI|nr:CRAL/TRIO domain-containing protein [Patellaria atrata CBS 101060]